MKQLFYIAECLKFFLSVFSGTVNHRSGLLERYPRYLNERTNVDAVRVAVELPVTPAAERLTVVGGDDDS
ncbi:hypothetical protein B9G49_07530 [Halorubrum sp. SD683]|nr:hypothetical protein B9G49_07530 [Halorubrum sp. SD683]